MLKTILFALLVVFVRPMPAASLMSHEKFVHMTYEEQKQVVIATMELIVAIEERYKHETRKTGFNLERFRRYTEFMTSVSNLIIPSAHAAPRNVRYGQYLHELSSILRQENRCIYGGWISSMGPDNLCTHPAYSNSQGFRDMYQSESSCTGSRNQITCNPAIFGFKNVTSKTLFCVPAGTAGADNTSRDCMRKALSPTPEPGASTKEQRIRNMIEGIAVNPNDANAVFDFLLKACICDAPTTQISDRYLRKIRPHQTCAAILNMMSEVLPQCAANPQLMDPNQLNILSLIKGQTRSLLFQNVIQNEQLNVNQTFEERYRTILNDPAIVTPADYQSVCGSAPPVRGGDVANQGQCVNERNNVTQALCCNAGRVPKQDNSACEADPNARPNDSIVVGEEPAGTDPINPTGDVVPPVDTTITSDTPVDTSVRQPPVCDSVTEQLNAAGDDCEPKTTTSTTTTTDQQSCEQDPTKEWINNQCREKCNPEREQRNTETFACDCKEGIRSTDGVCPQPTTSQEETACETNPEKEWVDNQCLDKCRENEIRNEENACVSAPASTSSVTLVVQGKNQTSTNITIEASLTPTTASKADYTIIWFKRGQNLPTINITGNSSTTNITNSSVTLSDIGEVSDPGEEDEEVDLPDPNRTGTEGQNETNVETLDGSWTLTAPRTTVDYKVCGRLIKKADNSTVGSNVCAEVKKQDVPRNMNRGGGQNPFGGQQPFMRGGPSNATFQGIR